MIRKLILASLCLVLSQSLSAQPEVPLYLLLKPLYEASSISDSLERHSATDLWWNNFQQGESIPLIVQDSVAFLYRGKAHSVEWMGDFNGWGRQHEFNNKGLQIAGTDVWVMTCSIPIDARLDYKIIVDQTKWILDPANPKQQWSGTGNYNSELRMHEWKSDPVLIELPGKRKGTVTKNILFTSNALGYSIQYSVYLPFEFENQGEMPVIFVTDGNEYMDPLLGNMITVLDNLIEDRKITPLVAVFIDHRDPNNATLNRRMDELNMNEKFIRFLASEFVPSLEKKYPIYKDSESRAILGTSMGGLASAYVVFSKPDFISLAGIQSPAFWVNPEIFVFANKARNKKIKISMTSGKINDTSAEARKMRDILNANGITNTYQENNEGHSWGNWKNRIDDILIDFFGF